jgi:hypothetical protein
MERRIKNEFLGLKKKYPNVILNDNSIILDNKKIIFDKTYPFTRPAISINDRSYIDFLRTPIKIHKILNKYSYNCLCCNTILCKWNPTYTVQNILDEITAINKIKIRVKYIILLDEICKKHETLNIVKTVIYDFLIKK